VEKINKTRPLERPKTWWVDVIAKDLIEIEHNVPYESTYDSERWRDLLKTAIVPNLMNNKLSRKKKEEENKLLNISNIYK